MNPTDAIGYLAAILTTASFVPQALHIWRTRDARAISLGMYAVFSTGVALWLAYGVLVGSWPVTLANVVTLFFALSILCMKIRYDREPRERRR
ncbi:SemiSWEET transporter [Aromatoleum toluolicum]|uniref:MtN3 and saliva related transmembrane protein n=1 Tax=Aromatoleum toluolicum TaxID=90060 RepID=A0ABX1NLE0_9RHOO|nr:SemiSWEET transporter [Aromatoleum toluolicum]NMG00168.1 SemiSWEET transporter [Aromatoleum toluolicum]